MQDAAADLANFSLKTAADGRVYFTLTASNGQIVGISQMYTSTAAAKSGMASVQSTIKGMNIL